MWTVLTGLNWPNGPGGGRKSLGSPPNVPPRSPLPPGVPFRGGSEELRGAFREARLGYRARLGRGPKRALKLFNRPSFCPPFGGEHLYVCICIGVPEGHTTPRGGRGVPFRLFAPVVGPEACAR